MGAGGVFGLCTHYKSDVILRSWVVAGLMGSFPMLTHCCCYPRSCPRGEHAPHHLHSHWDPRLHPLPRGGRAPSHTGQVEQGWPAPAHREGEQLERVAGKGVAAVPAWRVLALDRMDGAALPYQQLCSELIQVPADILSVSQPSQMTF